MGIICASSPPLVPLIRRLFNYCSSPPESQRNVPHRGHVHGAHAYKDHNSDVELALDAELPSIGTSSQFNATGSNLHGGNSSHSSSMGGGSVRRFPHSTSTDVLWVWDESANQTYECHPPMVLRSPYLVRLSGEDLQLKDNIEEIALQPADCGRNK